MKPFFNFIKILLLNISLFTFFEMSGQVGVPVDPNQENYQIGFYDYSNTEHITQFRRICLGSNLGNNIINATK